MDRNLSAEEINKRKKKIIIGVVIAIAAFAGAIFLFRNSIKPSLAASAIRSSIVEMGSIENTLNASGEILPEFEQVITSPIRAVIQNVVVEAGNEVKKGQSILELDKEYTELEYEKLKFQVESKHISITRIKLELEKSFYDLKANDSIKQLQINSLQATLEDSKRLLRAGGGTREEVEQAELNLKIAQLEKRQLENNIRSKQKTMQADMRESELAAQIQENDLHELQRKLQQASIQATRPGVITWVNKNIGSTISEGESLVRVADLGSFKVVGTISDTYLDQLRTSMPVIIRVNDSMLRGTVVNIRPSIQNNIVSFDIELKERSSSLLRPNMKVEVFLVTSMKNNVMRVANGKAFTGANRQDIFVLKDGKAYRRTVNIGSSNFDYVEIKDQVKPGETVIISDMSEFKHLQEIEIDQ